ncbi:glycosyltransferase family 4 protein [Mariprofundus sp. KV]|uniref:glycosyltransferase family 4 protein n=1 Tax=Mariprofundus sp. KV TaxID=2608715 RepID=UPI0015A4AE6C|nr:glycosyltransferase family 4 protein [Mariprofundus sp. KV]
MKVLIPRLVDESNHNAQNLNARALLKAWAPSDIQFAAFADSDDIRPEISRHHIFRLIEGRFWQWDCLIRYLGSYDAIFYPGHQWFDAWGIRLRKLIAKKVPVIATLEGIPWMPPETKMELEKKVGHEIHTLSFEASKHYVKVLAMADHVVAISPFLAEIGKFLFGDKFSVIPLGVDTEVFYPAVGSQKRERITVVCAGTAYPLKRPELFLALAKAIPDADFKWYGGDRDGLLERLKAEQRMQRITNLEFVGGVSPEELAEAFRKADLFVLPSLSEGVPKVAQEAAACDLPLILFGFYEAPTLIDGKNGVVVWDDDELISTVGTLIRDREKLSCMAMSSREMAKAWEWSLISVQWLEELRENMRAGSAT